MPNPYELADELLNRKPIIGREPRVLQGGMNYEGLSDLAGQLGTPAVESGGPMPPAPQASGWEGSGLPGLLQQAGLKAPKSPGW